jgi:predicted RNase H-like HicB family nuclease
MKQIIQIQVQAQVQWRVGRSSSGNYIGVCDPLNMTMEGSTLEELEQNINESIQLLMSDLMESGELERFLQDHGWRAVPDPRQQGPVEFRLPYNLQVRNSRGSARALLQ